MARKLPEIVELSPAAMEALLHRAESGRSSPEDYAMIRKVFMSYAYVTQALSSKNTTLARLRRILFGASTEKTSSLVGRARGEQTPHGDSSMEAILVSAGIPLPGSEENAANASPKAPRKGHGRLAASAYTGAERITIPHESLEVGMECPKCQDGTVYTMAPSELVRMAGQPPLGSKVFELEKLRCNLCGEIFTASPPPEIGDHKYDATASSMIGMLKYGGGFPFHRLEKLQGAMEVPLPAATQWDIVQEGAVTMEPAYGELVRQAAQGQVLHNDDTRMTILALTEVGNSEKSKASALTEVPASALTEAADQPIRNKDGSSRKEVSTSGIVSTCEGHKIALFFTGLPHAGENLEQVLLHRDEQRSAPIQMCDGLSRNLPSELQTILANCLTHARRKFVDEHLKFPDECAYVFAILEAVYTTDSQARKRCLSMDERLLLHQHESGPRMDDLLQWLKRQFAERLVEPNSGLGEAIRYMLKHWEPLTLFLRVAGAPLDNNICERALKRAILHRKNSLFYRTENGARVGDLYMSLIHTCQLNGVNPFNYLVTLQRENERVASHPEQWMPWNYKETLRKHGEVEMEVLSENPRSQTPRESLAKRRVRRLARRVLQATVK